MSITQIVSYKTSDGKTFTDEALALAHEESLAVLPLVIQFAQAKSESSRAHTRMVNLIREWEAYKASGGTLEVIKAASAVKEVAVAEVSETPVSEAA
jgi:hypothetical protein